MRPPPFSGVVVSSLFSGVVVVDDLRGPKPSPPPGYVGVSGVGVSGVVVVVVSSPCPSPP